MKRSGSGLKSRVNGVTTGASTPRRRSGWSIGISSMLRDPHACLGLGFDIASDVLVRGEPYPGSGAHVLDELFKDAQARAMADDMGVHGEQKQPSLDVGSVEFAPPDLPHQRWRGIRPNGRQTVHPEVWVIIFDPFHRQLHDTGWLALFHELVGLIVAHPGGVIQ